MSLLDLTDVKTGNDPLPADMYTVVIDDAELKDSRMGGKYINVKFKIIEGDFENRVVFDMFNIQNGNEVAQQIGLGKLKTLMQAAGLGTVLNDVSDLFGAQVKILTAIKNDEQYGEKTIVKTYKPAVKVEKDSIPF